MFDTLDAVLSGALTGLGDGAGDPGSPWRNLALGTIGLDGTPRVRTVVLRRFERPACTLEVHTDKRSAKHAELRANARAALHGWNAQTRVQLRLTGRASLHTADDVTDAAWSKLRPESRATYRVLPGPGTMLANPDEADRADDAAAQLVFCVIRLAIDELEWLHLGEHRHRRARFTWCDGDIEATWLVP